MPLHFENMAPQRPNFELCDPCKIKGEMGQVFESKHRTIHTPGGFSKLTHFAYPSFTVLWILH